MNVCQVALYLTLVAGGVATPVCIRLLMPEEWECDPERCRADDVPEDLKHDMSKLAMALEMVRNLRGLGVGSTASASTSSMRTTRIRSRVLSRTGSSMLLMSTPDMTVWLDPPLDAAGKVDWKARSTITFACGASGIST